MLADRFTDAVRYAIDLRADGEAVWERFNAGRWEQAWYYGELLAIFERRLPGSRNLPQLREVVLDLFGLVAGRPSSWPCGPGRLRPRSL